MEYWPQNSDVGKNLLFEKHLTIGAIELPPYVSFKNVSKNFKINDIDGFIYQIVLYMAAKYQFSFEYMAPPDGAYGALVNGSWNGLMGMINRKELDLIGACMVVTYPRSLVVDYTVQFYNDPVSLLMPYPTLDDTTNGIVRPFQYDVWIYIVISFLLMAFTLWRIVSLELWFFDKKKSVPRPTLYQSFWSLLDFNFVDMEIASSSRFPIRVFATVLCLASFVLVNAYSSTLTAYLMTPRYHPMVDSVEDVATMSRPVFMVNKFTSYETAILDAKEGVLFKIGESIRKFPELRLGRISRDAVVELVVKEQKTITTVRSSLLKTMENDLKKTGQCRIYLAKEPWDIARTAFILGKNSQLTPIFNRQINWLRDVGLLNYWERRYWPLTNKCSEPLPVSLGDQTPLNLDTLSSHFILLCCGLVGSSIVFIIEWIHSICTVTGIIRV